MLRALANKFAMRTRRLLFVTRNQKHVVVAGNRVVLTPEGANPETLSSHATRYPMSPRWGKQKTLETPSARFRDEINRLRGEPSSSFRKESMIDCVRLVRREIQRMAAISFKTSFGTTTRDSKKRYLSSSCNQESEGGSFEFRA